MRNIVFSAVSYEGGEHGVVLDHPMGNIPAYFIECEGLRSGVPVEDYFDDIKPSSGNLKRSLCLGRDQIQDEVRGSKSHADTIPLPSWYSRQLCAARTLLRSNPHEAAG